MGCLHGKRGLKAMKHVHGQLENGHKKMLSWMGIGCIIRKWARRVLRDEDLGRERGSVVWLGKRAWWWKEGLRWGCSKMRSSHTGMVMLHLLPHLVAVQCLVLHHERSKSLNMKACPMDWFPCSHSAPLIPCFINPIFHNHIFMTLVIGQSNPPLQCTTDSTRRASFNLFPHCSYICHSCLTSGPTRYQFWMMNSLHASFSVYGY